MASRDLSSQATALTFLRNCELDETVGGFIENYCEVYSLTEDERPVFERFLMSPSLDNRSAALSALIQSGKFGGYEADALLLHYEGRTDRTSQVEFDGINYLRYLLEMGSNEADRILKLLNRQRYVRALYGVN